MKYREPTKDAIEILYREFIEGRPEMIAALEKMRIDEPIAREIEELRHQSRLSQKQLAKLVGTTEATIDQLENADYEGDAQKMLCRIKKALRQHARIEHGSSKKVKTSQLALA